MKKRLFCLILALVFLLSACASSAEDAAEDSVPRRHRSGETVAASDRSGGKAAATPLPESAPAETPTPAPTPEAAPEPTPEAPVDPVVTVRQWEGDYSDDVGNDYHYLFRVPAFTCGSADAQEMNEALYDFVLDCIRDDLDTIEENKGLSLFASLAEYDVYQNEDYISVLCHVHNDWGQTAYCAKTLDLWTQREAGRETLLAWAGLNDQSFLERAREAAGAAFGDYTTVTGDLQQFAEDQYRKTVMDENLQDTQLFINEEGRLCMVVRIFSLAGADYYWRVVAL